MNDRLGTGTATDALEPVAVAALRWGLGVRVVQVRQKIEGHRNVVVCCEDNRGRGGKRGRSVRIQDEKRHERERLGMKLKA